MLLAKVLDFSCLLPWLSPDKGWKSLEKMNYFQFSATYSHSLDSDFSKIERGDCIIAFSQRELYRIRRIVESASKWKCAIIYGGLPPGTINERWVSRFTTIIYSGLPPASIYERWVSRFTTCFTFNTWIIIVVFFQSFVYLAQSV